MRDYTGLFRGKRTDNGEWVKGFYHYADWVMPQTHEFVKRTHSILPLKSQDAFDVDPATVGECAGLKDRNGTLIFEGDIIRSCNGEVYEVKWIEKYARFAVWKPGIVFGGTSWNMAEIIGNIHDNPELIGGIS